MVDETESRFQVVVEEGLPQGDLYELEQRTYYRIVDRRSDQAIMVFESLMEASLSRSTGLWEGYCVTGVLEVTIASGEKSLIVKYHDGLSETVRLPE